MSWFNKTWKWVVSAFAVIGAIAIYIFLSKDKTNEKIKQIESEIDDLEKDINETTLERDFALNNADGYAKSGELLDKEIEKAKKKQRNLIEKRDKIQNIFDKYNRKLDI